MVFFTNDPSSQIVTFTHLKITECDPHSKVSGNNHMLVAFNVGPVLPQRIRLGP